MRRVTLCVLLALLTACSSTGSGDARAHPALASAPAGWDIEQLHAVTVEPFGILRGKLHLYGRADADPASLLAGPWVAVRDGASEAPAPGHDRVVGADGVTREAWGARVEEDVPAAVAAAIGEQHGQPDVVGYDLAPTLTLRATIEDGRLFSDDASEVVLRKGRSRIAVRFVPLTQAEAAALSLLLVRDPSVTFRTEASVYDVDRYPKASSSDHEGAPTWAGMLSSFIHIRVLGGTSPIAVVTQTPGARNAALADRMSRQMIDHVEWVTSRDFDGRSRRIDGRYLDRERDRIVGDHEVLWRSTDGDVQRLAAVDPSPRFAGPDPGAIRRTPALCLVELRRRPEPHAVDACVVDEPIMSLGETGQPSTPTGDSDVWGTVDRVVDRVELRDGTTVLTRASMHTLDRAWHGRRKIFVLSGWQPIEHAPVYAPRADLRVVALDRSGNVLRQVHASFGGFHARPARPDAGHRVTP